jgi:hypothetical protein
MAGTGPTVVLLLLCGLLLMSGFSPMLPGASRGSAPSGGAASAAAPHAAGGSSYTYRLAFTATGLPSGVTWYVNLSGGSVATSRNTTSTLIVFYETGGSYSYAAGTINSPWPEPVTSGTVNLTTNQTVTVRFVEHYRVGFSETGLPSGTRWSVTFGGNTTSSTSYVFAFYPPNGTYSYTIGSVSGYSDHPSSGSVTVSGSGQNVSVTYSTAPVYGVVFHETGLAPGTTWSVVLSGKVGSSSTANITFPEANGTYNWSLGSLGRYSGSPSSGSVTVSGSNQTVTITYVSAYYVFFNEVGLAPGTTWTVTLGSQSTSSTTSTLGFSSLRNGTYNYAVGPVNGYTLNRSSGSVAVNGATVYIAVSYTIVRGSYYVLFAETGLPSKTTWAVDLAGSWGNSSTTTDPFTETNGSYSFLIPSLVGYAPKPASGTVTVAGHNQSVYVTFRAINYTLTFTESGLPSGANWSVTLTIPAGGSGHASNASTTGSIGFVETLGYDGFSVATSASGYYASPSSGTVYLNGTNQTVAVTFSQGPSTYRVTFTETGLLSGTGWSVTLSGHSNASTTSSIGFYVANGTHTYGVGAVQGYSAKPSYGYVNVSGLGASVSVKFTAVNTTARSYSVTFTETGLPNTTSWSVSIGSSSGTSNTTSITLPEKNGSYHWLATTTVNGSGYNVSGTVNVTGASVGVSVTFMVPAPLVALSFVASGLPKGADWTLTLTAEGSGLTIDAARSVARQSYGASTVSFWVSVGNYSFVAGYPGYHALSGSVAVSPTTTAPAITVDFAPVLPTQPQPTNTSVAAGPISGWAVGVGAAFVLIGAVGILMTVYRARRVRRDRGSSAVQQLFETEWEPDGQGEPLPRKHR